MKVIILDEIEQFCKEHNVKSVSLDWCRSMAILNDQKGQKISYYAGYGKAIDDATNAWAEKRPREVDRWKKE